jgi:hypothetical protein
LTLHGTELIGITAMIVGSLVGCYVLLLRKLHVMLDDRESKLADQMEKLDLAIRALETRIAKHQPQSSPLEHSRGATNLGEVDEESTPENRNEEGTEIAPEIQAALAAAAVATLGPNAVVHSVKAATSPWTQQGRVLVQGGHNLRVQR